MTLDPRNTLCGRPFPPDGNDRVSGTAFGEPFPRLPAWFFFALGLCPSVEFLDTMMEKVVTSAWGCSSPTLLKRHLLVLVSQYARGDIPRIRFAQPYLTWLIQEVRKGVQVPSVVGAIPVGGGIQANTPVVVPPSTTKPAVKPHTFAYTIGDHVRAHYGSDAITWFNATVEKLVDSEFTLTPHYVLWYEKGWTATVPESSMQKEPLVVPVVPGEWELKKDSVVERYEQRQWVKYRIVSVSLWKKSWEEYHIDMESCESLPRLWTNLVVILSNEDSYDMTFRVGDVADRWVLRKPLDDLSSSKKINAQVRNSCRWSNAIILQSDANPTSRGVPCYRLVATLEEGELLCSGIVPRRGSEGVRGKSWDAQGNGC